METCSLARLFRIRQLLAESRRRGNSGPVYDARDEARRIRDPYRRAQALAWVALATGNSLDAEEAKRAAWLVPDPDRSAMAAFLEADSVFSRTSS